MPVDKQLHELSGDDYINAAFDLWLREHDLVMVSQFETHRAQYFKLFKSAFTDGVNACTNGNYY